MLLAPLAGLSVRRLQAEPRTCGSPVDRDGSSQWTNTTADVDVAVPQHPPAPASTC